jgi:transcription initiation factor TFIIIB Brf1 subunit/transcription initiation factor TFIIB
MASNKLYRPGLEINTSLLECDLCHSTNILEESTGYICEECGYVLEIHKFEYHRPYDEDIVQYAVLSKTQIGSKQERRHFSNGVKLEKLNKIHSINTNEENLEISAKVEIRRILSALQLSRSLECIIFQKYQLIRSQISPRTKYRSPEKLIPIVIYYYHKLNSIPINDSSLLEVAKISKKDFNDFKLQINEFIPHYAERNRKEYITQQIGKLVEHFDFGMEFYFQAKRVLYKLWETIKNTKDSVIAGVVASILVLCNDEIDVKVSSICELLGIRMSTIQTQVEKHIFKRLRVSGFKSLIRSSNLLKEIMERLGLVESNSDNKTQEEIEIIEVKVGSVCQIFNVNNSLTYYFYAIRLDKGYLLVTLKDTDHPYLTKKFPEIKTNEKLCDHSKINLELWKYHMKGPPCYTLSNLSFML